MRQSRRIATAAKKESLPVPPSSYTVFLAGSDLINWGTLTYFGTGDGNNASGITSLSSQYLEAYKTGSIMTSTQYWTIAAVNADNLQESTTYWRNNYEYEGHAAGTLGLSGKGTVSVLAYLSSGTEGKITYSNTQGESITQLISTQTPQLYTFENVSLTGALLKGEVAKSNTTLLVTGVWVHETE